MEDGGFSGYLMKRRLPTVQLQQYLPVLMYFTFCFIPLSQSVLLGTCEAGVPRNQINLDYFQCSKSSYIIPPISVFEKCHSSVVIIALFVLSACICVTMETISESTPGGRVSP